jgi:hypothetical protein
VKPRHRDPLAPRNDGEKQQKRRHRAGVLRFNLTPKTQSNSASMSFCEA